MLFEEEYRKFVDFPTGNVDEITVPREVCNRGRFIR